MAESLLSYCGAPTRSISHSSVTPLVAKTRRRTSSPRDLDVVRAGRAAIDEKIAMQLRHLRVADDEPAATRGIDQLPCLMARRIFERRAAGAGIDRLGFLPRLRDLRHLRFDCSAVAGFAFVKRRGENEIVRHSRMAIGESHFRVAENV